MGVHLLLLNILLNTEVGHHAMARDTRLSGSSFGKRRMEVLANGYSNSSNAV